jgi:hypothetical protein
MVAVGIILLGAYSAITLRASTSVLTNLAKANEAISQANQADLKAAAHRQDLLSQILTDVHSQQISDHATLLEFQKDVATMTTLLNQIKSDQLQKDDTRTEQILSDMKHICTTLHISCPMVKP